jgi:hypothetical protein
VAARTLIRSLWRLVRISPDSTGPSWTMRAQSEPAGPAWRFRYSGRSDIRPRSNGPRPRTLAAGRVLVRISPRSAPRSEHESGSREGVSACLRTLTVTLIPVAGGRWWRDSRRTHRITRVATVAIGRDGESWCSSGAPVSRPSRRRVWSLAAAPRRRCRGHSRQVPVAVTRRTASDCVST